MPDAPSARPGRPGPEREPGTVARPGAVDILALLCAVFAVVSLALWGFVAWPLPWNLVAGIGAPVGAILLWALFVSPRAMLAVHPFVRAVVEIFVYLSATAAWWSLGQAWVGLVFAAVAVTAGVLSGRRRLS